MPHPPFIFPVKIPFLKILDLEHGITERSSDEEESSESEESSLYPNQADFRTINETSKESSFATKKESDNTNSNMRVSTSGPVSSEAGESHSQEDSEQESESEQKE